MELRSVLAKQVAGMKSGKRAEGVDQGEQGESGEDAKLLRNPTEGDTHQKLKDGGENGHGGLGAAHEVARHDEHERGLRHHA